MEVIIIDVVELGNRSYIVHDGHTAFVIDPSRRIDQLIDKARDLGLDIEAVFETHIHNDYVTGGFSLSQKLAIPYYISANDLTSFEHIPIKPEQSIQVGQLRVTALHSPGHTHSHTSYLVEHQDQTPALFSGGSLLYGAVGRPDLISPQATPGLARDQYQTAQFYLKRLKPETLIYPTHGFGSFCAATETESVNISTLKQQLKSNHVYISQDEKKFVSELLAGLDAYPSYYSYMATENLEGPLEANLTLPDQLTKEKIISALHDGVAIIDLRSRTAYSSKHLIGTYNIELNNSLATYVGWLISWQTPLILVGQTADQIRAAQEQLSLIGRELLEGHTVASNLLASSNQINNYMVKSFSEFASEQKKNQLVLIDVRRQGEWQKEHIKGALHIPLHQLENRLSEVPEGAWIHCAGGYRASIAASILDKAGKKPVLIDDEFKSAKKIGIIIINKEER